MRLSAYCFLFLVIWGPLLLLGQNPPNPRQDLSSAVQISQTQFFDQPLMPSHSPTAEENQALLAALKQFGQRAIRDDFSSLTDFLDRNPDSPWSLALQTQLGSEYYRVGRFFKTIPQMQKTWGTGQGKTG